MANTKKNSLWNYSDYRKQWLKDNGHQDLADVMEKEFFHSFAAVCEIRDVGEKEQNRLWAGKAIMDKVLPDRVEVTKRVDRLKEIPTGKLLDMMERLLEVKNSPSSKEHQPQDVVVLASKDDDKVLKSNKQLKSLENTDYED